MELAFAWKGKSGVFSGTSAGTVFYMEFNFSQLTAESLMDVQGTWNVYLPINHGSYLMNAIASMREENSLH